MSVDNSQYAALRRRLDVTAASLDELRPVSVATLGHRAERLVFGHMLYLSALLWV